MKLEKIEHNHKLTSILKVILFAILMIMPFLACLPSITYFAFNEHAENYTNQTITETYEYETNEIHNVNDFVIGNIYKCNFSDFFSTTFAITLEYFKNNDVELKIFDEDNFNIEIYTDDQNYILNENALIGVDFYNGDTDFYFIPSYITNITLYAGTTWEECFSPSDYLGQATYTINNNEMNPLSVFYTANEQVWEQPLFSWVNSGLFANSLGAFIGVFGIAQNSYFNNLLTYWLVLIIIYIIIDLILGLFTLITHIICNRKVKE